MSAKMLSSWGEQVLSMSPDWAEKTEQLSSEQLHDLNVNSVVTLVCPLEIV